MPLEIELDYDRGVPVYRQIYDRVVAALGTGRLTASEQLPTIVELARRLGINPNTVARAYRDLERDGYIVGQRGRGTFPRPRTPPDADHRDRILREIYDRAIAEGARHAIDAREIVRYFRRALHDRDSR